MLFSCFSILKKKDSNLQTEDKMSDWEEYSVVLVSWKKRFQTEDKMSDWEVAFCRAVGLLWLCLAQTGEAGESFVILKFKELRQI